MIKKNDKTIEGVYKGTTEIGSIYKGTLLVYESWKTLTASGVPPLTLLNCKGANLLDYKIYGETVQNGTPTWTNPIEYESVGDLVTDESDINYGKYKTPIIVSGKNLFNKSAITKNYYMGTTGPVSAEWASYSEYISIKPSTSYYFTDVIPSSGVSAVRWYDENKAYLSSSYFGSDSIYIASGSAVSPNNAYYCIVNVYNGYENTTQVEKGNLSTPYEPYVTPKTINIYLNEPLRRVSDGVTEHIDYIDFENQKVVRNCYELVVTGYEDNWEQIGSADRRMYRFKISVEQLGPGAQPTFPDQFCNYAECKVVSASGTEIGASVYHSSSLNGTFFRIRPDTTYSTLTAFVNRVKSLYDNGNPIKIVFFISTPTEESIQLPDISLNKGTNIIDVDTTITPSNMYVKYKGK